MTAIDSREMPDPEEDVTAFGYEQELKRSLSFSDLVVFGLIFMVPIAPMSIFGVVFNTSHGMVALTYLIGFVAMLFTALSYRQMARAFPVAGSVYSYVGRGTRPSAGFLAGWVVLLDYLLFPTLVAVFGAVAMHAVVPDVPQVIWVISYVVLSTVANYMGVEWAARSDKLVLFLQLVVLALFLVFAIAAIARGDDGAHLSLRPFFDASEFHIGFVFSAVSIAALSFLGFDAISTLSEEAHGGGRAVGRATIASLLIVVAMFVVLTAVASMLVPNVSSFEDGDATNNAFFNIAESAGGHWLKVVCALGVALLAAVGNILTSQAAVSRILYSMSRDRMMPAFLGVVHPVRKVPTRAILLVGGLTLALGILFVGQVDQIATLVNVGALLAFFLLNVSVCWYFWFDRRTGRVWTHLAFPVLGAVIIGFVLVQANPHAKIAAAAWVAVGVVVLVIRRMTGRSIELALSQPVADEDQ